MVFATAVVFFALTTPASAQSRSALDANAKNAYGKLVASVPTAR